MRQYIAQNFNALLKSSVSKVVVIDAASMTVYAITKLLARHPILKFVGYDVNGSAALSLCRKTMPDIVIIDPLLSGLDGPWTIKQLHRINPQLMILIDSHEHRQISLTAYIEMKVDGIVLKNSPLPTLVLAINALCQGQQFLDASLLFPVLPKVLDSLYQNAPVALPNLSPREKQVLKMIVEGGKNKKIVKIISISLKIIESHRLNIMRKLNAHSVLGLILWVQRMNISHSLLPK